MKRTDIPLFANNPFVKLLVVLSVFGLGNAGTVSAKWAATETEILSKPDDEPSKSEIAPPATGIPIDELPSLKPEDIEPSPSTLKQDALDNSPPPPVLRDFSKLPAPVKRMRELILSASQSGDIEKLRSLIGIGETATTLSIGGLEGDPIEHLRETSGDSEGIEILAILSEVLEAGYVHLDKGTDEEMYVWPYFFAWPLEKLTAPMKVELFRILTAGDVEDSTDFGGYIFYRVGIRPDGGWSFFVAGD